MSRRLIIRVEAEEDIAGLVVWSEGQKAGLGIELMGEIRAAIQRAVEHPHSFLRLRKSPEIRRILTRRFPYRIFFCRASGCDRGLRRSPRGAHDRHWRKKV